MSKDSTESYGSGDSDSFRFVCDRCAAGGDIFDLVKTIGFVSDVFVLFVRTQYEQKLSEIVIIWRFSKKTKFKSSIYLPSPYRGGSPYRISNRLRRYRN